MKNKKLFLITSAISILSLLTVFHAASALTLTPIRLTLSGDPGQTVTAEVTLINEKDTSETFYTSFANFEAQGETGTPTFKEGTEGLASWITASKSVFLPPGVSKKVELQIAIPQNTAPGGYFAAAFWGATPSEKTTQEVAIGTKIGTLILLRVNGAVKEEAQILAFDTLNGQHFFTALPVGMFYRFQNGGGDRALPKGDVIMRNFFGIKADSVNANVVAGNVLPGQIRRFEVVWSKQNQNLEVKAPSGFFNQVKYEWHNFALGRFSANLDIAYGASNNIALKAKTAFWVIPWQLLIIILIVAFLVFLVLKVLIKSYNSFIIKKAKESSQRMSAGKSGN